MRPRPVSMNSCLMSYNRVSKPACAATWAIPAPIVPAPKTATLSDFSAMCLATTRLAPRVYSLGLERKTRDTKPHTSPLFSRKYRRALFQERAHSFVVVCASARDFLQVGLVFQV